jgi:hypothetical protein
MFSNLFSSSISLATVTPSLVTVGEPKLFSMTTLRPLGPSVTLTASASALTPARIIARASRCTGSLWQPFSSYLLRSALGSANHDSITPRMSSSRMMRCSSPSILTSVPRVLAEEDAVALLDVELLDGAVLEHLAVAHGDDLALDRLLFRGVRDDEAALGALLLLHTLDDHAIFMYRAPSCRSSRESGGAMAALRRARTNHRACVRSPRVAWRRIVGTQDWGVPGGGAHSSHRPSTVKASERFGFRALAVAPSAGHKPLDSRIFWPPANWRLRRKVR